jgi:hypothetical protein
VVPLLKAKNAARSFLPLSTKVARVWYSSDLLRVTRLNHDSGSRKFLPDYLPSSPPLPPGIEHSCTGTPAHGEWRLDPLWMRG